MEVTLFVFFLFFIFSNLTNSSQSGVIPHIHRLLIAPKKVKGENQSQSQSQSQQLPAEDELEEAQGEEGEQPTQQIQVPALPQVQIPPQVEQAVNESNEALNATSLPTIMEEQQL